MPNGGINKQRYFDIDRFMSKNTVLFCGIFKGGILYNKTKHKKPRVVNSVQRTLCHSCSLHNVERSVAREVYYLNFFN